MDIYTLAHKRLARGVFLAAGSCLFGLALGLILSPNKLAAGGVAGISVILDSVFPLGVGTYTLLLNIPLIICAYRAFGRRFVLYTAAAVTVCALSADYFSQYDTPIKEPLLAAVFGGALMGLGCGAVFLCGATTGGTDIVTKLILRKNPQFSTGKVFLALDGSVCIAGGIVFKSLSNSLYAFIGLFVFSKVLDAVLYGGSGAKLVLIVTRKADTLLPQLLNSANVGCTVISARAGYTGSQASTLMCAIKKHRLHAVRTLAVRADSDAFILVLDAGEIYGSGFAHLEVRNKK